MASKPALSINRRCMHGAPPPGAVGAVALAVSQLVAKLEPCQREPLQQLELLEAFVVAHGKLLSSSSAQSVSILLSNAVDLFSDANSFCLTVLHAAAFLEAYGLSGGGFLSAIHDPGGHSTDSGFAHFNAFMDACSDKREDIAAQLRSRIPCGCLRALDGVPVAGAAAPAAPSAAAAGTTAPLSVVYRSATSTSVDVSAFHVCGTCRGPARLVCARCKQKHYCSRLCQENGWGLHKAECKKASGALTAAASGGK